MISLDLCRSGGGEIMCYCIKMIMLHYYYYIHFGWQGEQKLVMTLIVIGLDTTQLCTELIVCDWNCQDFFCVASVARPLWRWLLFCQNQTPSNNCHPMFDLGGPLQPFVSLFSFKLAMLTLRFILRDNFIGALLKIKSQVSYKKAICRQWMSALSGALLVNNRIELVGF